MIAAVDIGGTKIDVGLVSPDGRIAARGSTPADPQAGFAAAIERVARLFSSLSLECGVKPVGIGIGCTGPIDPISGVLGNVDTLPGWEGNGLTEALSTATGLPCVVENDADAHALGEYALGSGAGADPFIMITVGTGIGGGIILAGKIYRGMDGVHPELGHHSLDAIGHPCVCGARGCWEALAAGPSWENWFRAEYPLYASWTGREICAAAAAGDPRGQRAVEREGFYLGVGLANLISLFAPRAITLGGGLMQHFPLFEPYIRAEIQARCAYIPHTRLRLGRAALGADSGLLGAAEVWKLRGLSLP
jgi:glucokinase